MQFGVRVQRESHLDLKCIVGISACRWEQLFCWFVVSYIPLCISYKKLESDGPAVRSIAVWISSIAVY